LLYALTPRGLGTPDVESLSSYVTRLAEAHVVSVWRLIRLVLSPERPRRISCSTARYAYPANRSEILLQRLEAATRRRDLRLLTLCIFQTAVSQPNIFRTTEAWCPGCLEHWRTTDAPVYSPLLWAIRAVTVCPVHTAPLVERCPHCHSRFASLKATARPGYCAICSQWLGTLDLPSSKDSVDEQRYNLWASTSIGQVLVAMPDQRSAEHMRIAREHRDAVMRKEVFEIVRELCENNIYPSLPRVKAALSPGLARSWLLLWPIIDEARSQFGAAIRPRNELGQFV